MVPLTRINYNSNQHRESFPYELCKYSTRLLQRDGVVMMVLVENDGMDDDDDDDDDDPDEA